ncbi:uncharacterized protein PHACADRAFT_162913 [Phanerochaete carnosa HHB-10118-sp]|uniref:Uncharacterized protein n=1 Tax=Phanerochaete carnosa (strain HHB-10118-sp) TaxID=650164 RepID=K5VSP1_PHACS|nr:uncharacterized protein PHACADRAFT_162913 [Phanerochaete carnosa HHB-10118-sp]EKM54518.1 hypothetical protein PHACADRAFT_162913 [Phanerochaete carnosa HHB-10118-sp]
MGYDELEELQSWSPAINWVVVLGFAAVFGVLLWFLGGNRIVKRFAAGRGRGLYRRVNENDVEKLED